MHMTFHPKQAIHSFILHPIPLGTPTPSLPPSTTTPTGTSFDPRFFLRRRRPHEGEIHADGLIEQFGAVGAGNGGAGGGLSRVFEEDVSLHSHLCLLSVNFSPTLYSAGLWYVCQAWSASGTQRIGSVVRCVQIVGGGVRKTEEDR